MKGSDDLALCQGDSGDSLAELRRALTERCGDVVQLVAKGDPTTGALDVVADVANAPGTRRLRDLKKQFGLRRLTVRQVIRAEAAGLKPSTRLLSALLAMFGGKGQDMLKLSGTTYALATHFGLDQAGFTELLQAAGWGFAGVSLGQAAWFPWSLRNPGRLPRLWAVMLFFAVAVVSIVGMAALFLLPPGQDELATLVLAPLTLLLGFGLSITNVVRPELLRLSRDRSRDSAWIERIVVVGGALLAMSISAVGWYVVAWLGLLVFAAATAALGWVLYPPLAQQPPERSAEARPKLRHVVADSSALVVGGATGFAAITLTYVFALLALKDVTVPALDVWTWHIDAFELNAFSTTVLISAIHVASFLLMRLWEEHVMPGIATVIVAGGIILLAGTFVTWAAAGAALHWRLLGVVGGVIAAEVGLNPFNSGLQAMLSMRRYPTPSTLSYYIVRGVFSSAIAYAMSLDAVLSVVAVGVVFAGGAACLIHALCDREPARHVLREKVWHDVFHLIVAVDPSRGPNAVTLAWNIPEWQVYDLYYWDLARLRVQARWADADETRRAPETRAVVKLRHFLVRTPPARRKVRVGWSGRRIHNAAGTPVARVSSRHGRMWLDTPRPTKVADLFPRAVKALHEAGLDLCAVDEVMVYGVTVEGLREAAKAGIDVLLWQGVNRPVKDATPYVPPRMA